MFDCAFISLLEEYNCSKTPRVLIYYVEYAKYAIFVQYVEYVLFVRFVKYACFTFSTYVAYLQSGWITMDPSWSMSRHNERKENKQVLYVVPITSILGRLALIPVGDTGTIPFSMRSDSASYPGAVCDSRHGAASEQAMGAGGGMSTLGQWHGPQNSE